MLATLLTARLRASPPITGASPKVFCRPRAALLIPRLPARTGGERLIADDTAALLFLAMLLPAIAPTTPLNRAPDFLNNGIMANAGATEHKMLVTNAPTLIPPFGSVVATILATNCEAPHTNMNIG